ncbi:ABC transporter permease [Runella sp. MFBS21]|uniref:ABC transporter permease n=1 Tax=Runella sp. MFBS21 TaxID=3034018 RepID=UPI0023F75203|nr:ABC transporter permease [Runella sp. MFBS21]MDF7821882.1 ABC transporter permease [Runella sp. MFBS21]
MIRNYLKIAFRNLWKNKTYLFINLIGLSVAFGVSILLFLSAYLLLTYDNFHEQNGAVYRVYHKVNSPQGEEYGNSMPLPMRGAMKAEYPEVKLAVRVMSGAAQIQKNDKLINQGIIFTDPDYLQVFGYKLLKGNPQTALNDLSSVILREDIAKNIFGEQDPIGKTLNISHGDKEVPYVVSGIIEKGPENTSIQNEMLVRIETAGEFADNKDRWDADQHALYVKLDDQTNPATFEKRLKAFTAKYYKSNIEQLKKEGAKADAQGDVMSTRIIGLSESHFDSRIGNQAISKVYPYTLLIVGVIILLIAAINFINLSIAKSFTRAKEVGMRKALGAFKGQIVGQFWGEAFLICIAAFGLGLFLSYALLPHYNAIFRSSLSLNLLQTPSLLLSIFVCFALVTLVAGGYPAWAVTRFNTVEVLKGKVKVSGSSGGIRNTLIIFQFTMSVLLIACTLIVWTQINYLRSKPLGFNTTQVYSIPIGHEVSGKRLLKHFRNRLANQPRILSMTGSDVNLGRGLDGSFSKSVLGFEQNGKSLKTNMRTADYDYTKTLDLKLLQGREFSEAYATDTAYSVIINEAMAKQLGVKNPLGVILNTEEKHKVIGVVQDFHFESLHRQIEAVSFFMNGFSINYIFVKIAPDHVDETIALLKKTYAELAPKSEFQGSFLDENINKQYQREERLSKIFFSAATLAIILSCLGLFAIAIMVISQRTKEIGVRKVLGASVFSITALLSADFLKMVGVAILIASPIAWWIMDKWLTDFAYRTSIEWWVFVVTALLAVGIAIVTISFQAIKAALTNPTSSLRSE